MTTEEEKADPRNINIPESQRQREVEALKGEIPDISKALNTRQVNIGLDA